MNQSVLVIGGGIAGIQAAIDLAGMGFQVYLVERTSSIGGRMAQLDKTFPTNDCSICILAPKMAECSGQKNIQLLTKSEVVEVRGKARDFQVKVLQKPRFVDESKCTGCGDCTAKCPVKVPNEFNLFLDDRKAIYLPFPQAVPRKMTIDAEHCRYFTKGKCRLCERVCQAGAIDLNQEEKTLEFNVEAIVLATGLDLCDLSPLEEYGYGKMKNVITGLEYERLICASGPTNGNLVRPSDRKVPSRLAFIQCVGSRDVRNNRYCSSVCCMHATKQAILAREHYSDVKSFIFYTDLRAVGKRFQEYVARARQEYGVSYIRSRPGQILEDEQTKNLTICYEETATRELRRMEVDLVVLCQALGPSRSNREIANMLDISLDDYGFVAIPDGLFHPVDTERAGIFACGFCQRPQDIPDCVTQASGTAARIAELVFGCV